MSNEEKLLNKILDSAIDISDVELQSRMDLYLATLAGEDVSLPEPISRSDYLMQQIVEKGISGGNGGNNGNVAEKDVNFYDYNGKLLYSYTLEEAHNLTELPTPPDHTKDEVNLVCDGWSETLEKVNAAESKLNICAMYHTSDSKVHLIVKNTNLSEGGQGEQPGIDFTFNSYTTHVDWGDGTEEDLAYSSETVVNHKFAESKEYHVAITSSNKRALPIVDKKKLIKAFYPDNVTSIGFDAFYNCPSLQSVVIPSSVASIGSNAFGNCYSLQSVVIPSSVTSIREYTFGDCLSLQSVVIPSSVTSIGSNAFYYCSSLQGVVIPNSVASIGSNAFYYCYSLQSAVIPNSVKSIGEYAFGICPSLQSVVIPSSVASIGSNAFQGSSLQSVVIPSSVASIGSNAFYYCSSLQNLTFISADAPRLDNANAFYGLKSNYIIYVPDKSRYTSATNWSSLSDHIVEYQPITA